MPFGIGLPELIIVFLIAVVVFGPKRLPDLGRGLGAGMREFKDSITGGSKDDDHEQAPKIATSSTDQPDDAVSRQRT